MSRVLSLACVRCAHVEAAPGADRPLVYACTRCGGNLEVTLDIAHLRRTVTRASLAANPERSLWRYAPFYPVAGGPHVARLAAGGTPLLDAPRLSSELGLDRLWLKDDSRNPSASFKDRAGAIALALAIERREPLVAGASTGNAASSLACLAARTGVRTLIFVPQSAPAAKLAQILLFGAQVVAVRGSYDQAFDLCASACREYGWFNRNTGSNPYTREGKKSAAFEIAEQMGWRVPDWVFVGTGDGNILSGVWKGFVELLATGLVERTPRMVAVQAQGSNAIQAAFDGDGVIRRVSGKTIADSISVELPRDGDAALRALRESRGFALSVSDEEIVTAMRATARLEGVFAEPAAAAAIAGVARALAERRIDARDSVVALITGSGLKDVATATRVAGAPLTIEPELGALARLIQEKRIQT
jgi:threonine synthase